METIEPDEPQPAVVQLEPIRLRLEAMPVTIALRPNLWLNWTRIALHAEARAVAAHARGLSTGDIGPALEAETHETMIAVSGARHAFHHLYLDWHELLGLAPEDDEHKVPLLATTDVPANNKERDDWRADLREIVADRDEIIHVAQISQPAVPHPLGTNTSVLSARFTAERATRAIDLMLDFYRRVIESPTPALAEWSSKHQHVLGDLRRARDEYHARVAETS
jgi:hypothetical protein